LNWLQNVHDLKYDINLSHIFCSLFMIFSCVCYWSWMQGLVLVRQVPYYWAMTPGLFWGRILLMPSMLWTMVFLLVLSHIVGNDRCTTLHSAVGWDWVMCTFSLGWPQNMILPISTSWVGRITDLSQQAWHLLSLYMTFYFVFFYVWFFLHFVSFFYHRKVSSM
jgi:hypothetical protein